MKHRPGKPYATREEYPESLLTKAGLLPIGDLEPWDHSAHKPLSLKYLERAKAELEDPAASSEGHRNTLRECRRLIDEIARLKRLYEDQSL